jgi:hypothetical protein
VTAEQLMSLGVGHMAYLKVDVYDGEQIFIIYGADGTSLEAVDTIETAVERVAESGVGLVLVGVH